MEEIVSIIVPVYNVPELYLRKCIQSLIGQTYRHIEIILVDDGSTNGASDICDEYCKFDDRIKVIHKTNEGLSAARNTGYFISSGKWITFVDGDDWVEPDMCEKMVNAALLYEVQVVMCCMYKDYPHSSEKYIYYIKPNKKYTKAECNWLQEQILHFNGNIATAYCKLIERDLITRFNILHDEILRQGAEGIEFNLRLFEHIESAVFIDEYLYHYIYNEDSISSKHDERNHQYVLNCLKKIKIFIENSNNRERLMYWFNNRVLYVIITTAISGYFSPMNQENFKTKKIGFENYLKSDVIQDALRENNIDGMSFNRRLVLFFIRHKIYFLLNLLGYVRKVQKTYR